MDQELIGRWNSVISPGHRDEVWHLGDLGKGSVNLHGHSHGRLKPLPRQFDVGVDVWDFQPVSLSDILAKKAIAGRLMTG